MCSNPNENTDHCLFDCHQARKIWRKTFNRVFLDEEFNRSFADRWLKIDSNSTMAEMELVVVTCWSIWNDKNRLTHGEQIPGVEFKSQWIVNYLEKYLQANMKNNPSINSNPQTKYPQLSSRVGNWVPPLCGLLEN